MKLWALLAVCVGAFLAASGIAAAATPQGKLTGSATISGITFVITTTVIDGGTSYVGLENDKSGNCFGDSGQVSVNGAPPVNILCAHFVASSGCCNAGSAKMRLAYPLVGGGYNVVRITDNGESADTWGAISVTSGDFAVPIVNKGSIGALGSSGWAYAPPTGNYTVTPVRARRSNASARRRRALAAGVGSRTKRPRRPRCSERRARLDLNANGQGMNARMPGYGAML